MTWIVLYGAVAVAAAALTFVAADWFREPGTPAADHPGRIALLTGLLWPVVMIGLAQWAAIARLRPRQVVAPPTSVSRPAVH